MQNNRDNILLSKELVTIHCSVPVELELEHMQTQAPDVAAARALFTELEFTTLLKELAPPMDAARAELIAAPTEEEMRAFFSAARAGFAIAVDVTFLEALTEQVSEIADRGGGRGSADAAEPVAAGSDRATQSCTEAVAERRAFRCRFCRGEAARCGCRLPRRMARGCKTLLEDAAVPKIVHDLKATMRTLEAARRHDCGRAR